MKFSKKKCQYPPTLHHLLYNGLEWGNINIYIYYGGGGGLKWDECEFLGSTFCHNSKFTYCKLNSVNCTCTIGRYGKS